MKRKTVRKIRLAFYMLAILLSIYLCISHKQTEYKPFPQGNYILELMVYKEDGSIQVFPVKIYTDPEWAYILCDADKKSLFVRDMKAFYASHVLPECAKYYGNEI